MKVDVRVITFSLRCVCKFISPEVTVINLFANLRVFLVGLGNLGEFLSFFIEVSEEN